MIDETYTFNINNNHNEYILKSLNNFYGSANTITATDEINRVLPILSGQSKLSIRVIDWFVTNYSKKKNIIYPHISNNGSQITYFNVYLDYKSQLKGYKKKLFDPFCRKHRIPFYYTTEMCLITTIGQLNFFKWAIFNKVLDFIEQNFDIINKDMNDTLKTKYNSGSSDNSLTNSSNSTNSTSSSSDSKNSSRHELSENASKSINCYKMKIILDIN